MINADSRKLSAILATDIVGYSALLEQNEQCMLEALRTFRSDVLDPQIDAHNGKIVKDMGDGWLVEFGSAVAAVGCAAAIQQALVNHELIRLRVGVHVGDIVHDQNDIFGDGVNIAARLEQLASPGSVLISDVTHGFVDGKTDCQFENLGNHLLKNISKEQLIFGWAPEQSECDTLLNQSERKIQAEKYVASLFLVNELTVSGTNDEAMEVAEELHDELVLVLSRRAGLKVVSEPKDGIKIDYMLNGRVKVRSDTIRVNIQISDEHSGENILVERFSNTLDEMDELITVISNRVSGFMRNLTNAISGARYSKMSDSELSLGELLAKSAHLIQRWDEECLNAARKSLEVAIKLAPDNAMALAMMASTYPVSIYAGYGTIDEAESHQALEFANKAVSINQNIDFIFEARAIVKCYALGDLAGARMDCERALKINPYYHVPHSTIGMINIFEGNTEKGIEQLQEFITTVPEEPTFAMANSVIAMGYLICGEHDKALHYAREGYELSSSLPLSGTIYSAAAANFPEIVNSEEFRNMIDRLKLRLSHLKKVPLARQEDIELMTSHLIKAGIGE